MPDDGDYGQQDEMMVEDVEMTPAEERRRDYNRSPRGDDRRGRGGRHASPDGRRQFDDRQMRDDDRRPFDDRRLQYSDRRYSGNDRDRRGGRFARDDSDRYHANHHDISDRELDRRVEIRSNRPSPSIRKKCFAFQGNFIWVVVCMLTLFSLSFVEKGFCARGDECRYEHISKDEDDLRRQSHSQRGGFDRDRGGPLRGSRGRGRGRGGGAFSYRIHPIGMI